MSSEGLLEREYRGRRMWYLWILAGVVVGAIFGPAGMGIGGITEALIVFTVNFLPGGNRQTLLVTCLVIALGLVTGAIIGFNPWTDPKDSLLGFLGASYGVGIGFLMAVFDRVFVWVVFPEGTEVPAEELDASETDPDADDVAIRSEPEI